jgi:hypothetical protein
MTPDQKVLVFALLDGIDGLELHHGDCVGADADAHAIARALRARVVVHPPWVTKKRAFCHGNETRDPLPYLERNHHIVDETDMLIATPRGPELLRSGTWATVRYARQQGKVIVIIEPGGGA